ncbi:MAG: D-alanyl-D-alanine carboxypeptidase [Desulfobacterota bacterium]|nr:D-alanyl-D-alanine carboxypeptidase [Thermodesulfobacteriota bacterium]
MHWYNKVMVLALMVMLCAAAETHAAKPTAKKTPPAQQPRRDAAPQGSAQGTATLAAAPYRGAILVDAASGAVLWEDNADATAYPASIVKLMTLLLILEQVQAHTLSFQDVVTVTAGASKIGGSQVFLKEHETFTVDELLYALIVQSANDAAVALALHVAGTTEAFVELMNRKARDLGMTATVFHSVHGLPPGKDQQPDVSTPRDIVKLCRELLKYPDALRYTATRERPLRADAPQPFIMRTHNHLLRSFEGCDGFKTGYFRAAGYSIAATATKKGVRVIAVVMGSTDRKQRDAKARELLARGIAELVRQLPPPPPIKAVAPIRPAPHATVSVSDNDTTRPDSSTFIVPKYVVWRSLLAGAVLVLVLIAISLLRNVKRKSKL